jgi:hypothetical protein
VVQLYPQAPSTHFSRLLRHAWATVGLFFSPVTTRGNRPIREPEIPFQILIDIYFPISLDARVASTIQIPWLGDLRIE